MNEHKGSLNTLKPYDKQYYIAPILTKELKSACKYDKKHIKEHLEELYQICQFSNSLEDRLEEEILNNWRYIIKRRNFLEAVKRAVKTQESIEASRATGENQGNGTKIINWDDYIILDEFIGDDSPKTIDRIDYIILDEV